MQVTKYLVGRSSGPMLFVDSEALHLVFLSGDPAVDTDERFPSLDEMAATFAARIAPWLREQRCVDTDTGRPLEVGDLGSWLAELAACITGPEPVGETPLDTAVLALAALLRQKINEGLGPEPIRLHEVVFVLGDSGLQGFRANGASELRRAGYSLEDHELDEAFADWGDPSNVYDPVVSDALTLACAHVEATPGLRGSVEAAEGFRVGFVFHGDDDAFPEEERGVAAQHVGRPAAAFFAR